MRELRSLEAFSAAELAELADLADAAAVERAPSERRVERPADGWAAWLEADLRSAGRVVGPEPLRRPEVGSVATGNPLRHSCDEDGDCSACAACGYQWPEDY